ncbi:AfsR/SARP family transcriptional regulator [Plantactinospora sp. KBS50]|uniref:AfsR/SARP family transcriptional regulator n=1 Tax=Plantactinospora sp. KBS50 TaxID=2024580 RepID=UPI0018DF81F6|nr:AfsR/SARP family transcriptional regulator [Plantactinospora sp. KBS50]
MWFRVLGPLEVVGTTGHLSFPPRQRTTLAMLLLEPNRVVTVERLVDAVWENDPPPTAKEQVRICVSAIRRALTAGGRPDAIVTRPPGYSIQCTDRELDLLEFNDLVANGRRLLGQGRPHDAADAFRDALRLWRDAVPLAGVRSPLVQSIGTQLAERRLAVLEEYVDVRLGVGQHHELTTELAELVAANPFRERLRARLMIALYRSGRQAEALHTYRVGRQLFVEQLGLEPGVELRRLERAILAGEVAELLEPEEAARPVPVRAAVPRLLPADIGDFTGRRDLIERVWSALREPRDAGSRALPVVVITGRPWLGKTTLAVHVAHALDGEYPDGQLFARLGGAASPADAGGVLARFLNALGVPSRAVPDTLEERTDMYRNLLSDRRVLVVLDDAASGQQVAPLLPGGPTCSVILTSRTRLAALGGATTLGIGPLDARESVELLAKAVGQERVDTEAADISLLADLCAGEPLALRLAAGRLKSQPHWPVRDLILRLYDDHRRLTELSYGGLDLVAMVNEIWQGLSPLAQRLLRRVSRLDDLRFQGWMCAPLLDVGEQDAQDALTELLDAGLLDIERQDGQVVFQLRGLLRAFARRLAAEESSSGDTGRAAVRVPSDAQNQRGPDPV